MKAPKNELLINFDNELHKRRLFAHLRNLKGPHYIATSAYRKRRSNPQNRFYWGVVVALFVEFLNAQGEAVTAEEAHDLMRAKFLRQTVHDPRTGEPIGVTIRSSASLTTEQFSIYVEQCVAWLADHFDIVLPMPGEMALASTGGQQCRRAS